MTFRVPRPCKYAALFEKRICANCNASVHQKLSIVEHVVPVVPVTGFDSWDAYIERMQSANLAVYCEPCAKEKTKAENAQRAEFRRLVKAQNKPEKKKGKK
jgi:5-methylcytosine-specific restriction endonuclease McrA